MALDPDFLGRLASAHRAPRGEAAEECPDPAELAALVEGQVAESSRPGLERHLTSCEPCLATVLALEAERTHAEASGRRAVLAIPAVSRWRTFALAAAAVLVVALGVFAFLDGGGRGSERDPLGQALARIAQSDVRLHKAVAELSEAELTALEPAPMRGAFRVLWPQGRQVGPRPAVRVEPVAGATRYDVTVSDPMGLTVAAFSMAGPSAPWPEAAQPLPEGQAIEYVIKIEADGAVGRVRALGAFRTASSEETVEARAADDAISAVARGGAAALLRGRRALRLGAYEAAERALREASADPATSRAAAPLLDALGRRIGAPGPR